MIVVILILFGLVKRIFMLRFSLIRLVPIFTLFFSVIIMANLMLFLRFKVFIRISLRCQRLMLSFLMLLFPVNLISCRFLLKLVLSLITHSMSL